jgi:hypothetical protein
MSNLIVRGTMLSARCNSVRFARGARTILGQMPVSSSRAPIGGDLAG